MKLTKIRNRIEVLQHSDADTISKDGVLELFSTLIREIEELSEQQIDLLSRKVGGVEKDIRTAQSEIRSLESRGAGYGRCD